MKLRNFGLVTALTASALFGCSADKSPSLGEKDSSVSFNLLAGDVSIAAIDYDLNTQAGADVVNGSIQVPDDDSQHVPLLGIQSLGSGDYLLLLSATGTRPGGVAVSCTSATTANPLGTPFHLNPGEQNHFVGDITLRCTETNQVDTTGSATADVSVVVDVINVGGVVEPFTYGPRNVKGKKQGTACVFTPTVHLKVSGAHTGITYSWAAPTPDGTLTMNATNTEGDYQCVTGGTKTLALTGTSGGQSTTKTITVNCDATACSFECGNGILEGTEQCDDTTPHCDQATCTIDPVCGDGVIDTGECEPPGTAACSATCVPSTPFCGDGFITGIEQCEPPNTPICSSTCQNITGCGNGVLETGLGEQCDNGANNSNTVAGACRTNCQNPSCGDNVVDSGEQCDPPAAGTCSATCQTVVAPPARHVACHSCLTANANLGEYQTTVCDIEPLCVNLQNCAVDNDCFSPVAAVCWCGIADIDACRAPAFAFPPPTNTLNCVPQISAGYGNPTSNVEATDRLFIDDGTYPAAPAFSILNVVEAFAPECAASCL